LTKELNLNIEDIPGTGKDGRVLKEDVQKYAYAKSDSVLAASSLTPVEPLREDRTIPLTPVQNQMFKAMTRSLQIPHFLYTDSINFTELNRVRRSLNVHYSSSPDSHHHHQPKLSALPFILKSVSLALTAFPSLNAHLDMESDPQKPKLTHKAAHNIGVAVDTPQGLLVPVIHNVQSHSILSLATELQRLSTLARANKLSTSDLSGATFTISNIGSLGGGVVAPVITNPQVAILGVGRSKAVPAFDEKGQVVKREEAMFSWSADHRVVDGAMMARFAESVKGYLEQVENMIVRLR
jgi:2-oxoisovalerate dehydrogenase E2 component (dihydrolipoyl transacylase)